MHVEVLGSVVWKLGFLRRAWIELEYRLVHRSVRMGVSSALVLALQLRVSIRLDLRNTKVSHSSNSRIESWTDGFLLKGSYQTYRFSKRLPLRLISSPPWLQRRL